VKVQRERIVTLSDGLLLDMYRYPCQAVTVHVLFWGVLTSSDGGLCCFVENESIGQCLC
jgi:hypothetical protein